VKRRGFLKKTIVGSLVLAGAAVGVGALPGDRSSFKPRRALVSLDAAAFSPLVAVAARVLLGTAADPVAIAHRVDDALRFMAPDARADVNGALRLIDNALLGLLLCGRPTAFTASSAAAQDRRLAAMSGSGVGVVRAAYHAIRKLCFAAHYGSPEAWAEVGYGGPSLEKPAPTAITPRGPLATATFANVTVTP
jgi:hypothetical protein